MVSYAEESEKLTVPAHQRKKKRTHDDWINKLEIKEEIHIIEHPICDKCGAEMSEMGKYKAYDELVYTPAKFHIRRHIVKLYKCTECGVNPENDTKHEDDIEHCNIRRAEYPGPMIPGSYCSPELLAHIAYLQTQNIIICHKHILSQEFLKDLHTNHHDKSMCALWSAYL